MKDFKISQEEINKSLLLSPYSLSDSPRDYGLKAGEIKRYFYQFIAYIQERLNLRLEDIGNAISTLEASDEVVYEKGRNQLDNHNSSQLSHGVLFTEIRQLISSLGQALSSHGVEENAHFNQIDKGVRRHEENQNSHTDIRKAIKELLALSQNAYSLAQGKSRVIPLYDVYELLDCLKNSEQSPGDVFIFEQRLIPDLIFYKSLTEQEAEIELENGAIALDYDSYALGQVELSPGQVVIAYNKKLVGTESGVDLSRLATKERVQALENRTQELSTLIENGIADLLLLLEGKESKRILKEDSTSFTLENLCEYRFSTIPSLKITLPQTNQDIEAIISFHSGTEPTVFEQPSGLIMSGDDCQDGVLLPVSNRIYEISIKRLMGAYIGKVSCVDYEVI